MATTRAEQREATRHALLAEGRRRFGAEGYHDVVLTEIAQASGVTKGAAYHHFGSKLGLFRAVAAELQHELGERVAEVADRHGDDPWERLLAGCRAFLAAGSDPTARRVLLVDAPTVLGWDEWRAMDEDSSARHLAEALEAVAAAGLIADRPMEPLARLLSGAMNEAALWLARSEGPQALEQTEQALERLLNGLRTDR